MAITRVQSAISTAAGADPGTATFGSALTAGNLLIAIGAERGGGSLASGTATISGSGWTQIVGRDTELANASFRRAFCAFWKIAGASEPTTVTIDNGTTNTKTVVLQEFNDSGGGTWDFSEKADNDNGTTNGATSIGTGTTASTSGTQLVVSVLMARADSAFDASAVTWATAGSPIGHASASFHPAIATGFFETISAGTKTDTASVGSDNTGLSAGVMVFVATSDGGGNPANYYAQQ